MKNPLLQHKFATPHDTFPFADITVPDIEAAMLKGIEIERGEVDAIARSADEPSFRNTIVALSYAGKMLERASTLMYNQLSANTSDELEQLAEKMSPILSEHSASITLNGVSLPAECARSTKKKNGNPRSPARMPCSCRIRTTVLCVRERHSLRISVRDSRR